MLPKQILNINLHFNLMNIIFDKKRQYIKKVCFN